LARQKQFLVTMPPAPLQVQVSKVLARNVNYINSVGDMPYRLCRPFLLSIENPSKLEAFEEQSPHLKAHTGEIWIKFIERDVPGYRKWPLPENPPSWSVVYHELRQRDAKENARQVAKVKAKINAQMAEKKANAAVIMGDSSIMGKRMRARPFYRSNRITKPGQRTPKAAPITMDDNLNAVLKKYNSGPGRTPVTRLSSDLIAERKKAAEAKKLARQEALEKAGVSSMGEGLSSNSSSIVSPSVAKSGPVDRFTEAWNHNKIEHPLRSQSPPQHPFGSLPRSVSPRAEVSPAGKVRTGRIDPAKAAPKRKSGVNIFMPKKR
jgi:elongin-A